MCANDSNGLTALSRNFFAFVRAYCRNPLLTRRVSHSGLQAETIFDAI